MEAAIPQIRFHKSIRVIQKLNVDDGVVNTRRSLSEVHGKSVRRAQGRVLNYNMFVQCVSVRVSCHTNSRNIICQFWMMESHFFLLKFYNDFQRRIEIRLNLLVSLSMFKWWIYLALLRQSQIAIKLLDFLLKNSLRS